MEKWPSLASQNRPKTPSHHQIQKMDILIKVPSNTLIFKYDNNKEKYDQLGKLHNIFDYKGNQIAEINYENKSFDLHLG